MTQAGGLGPAVGDELGPDVSIDRLLLLLSSLSGNDKRRGIAAAIKAVLAQHEGLVHAFRLNRNTQNKTPLSIVHEYATRLGLELTYVESAESQLGPFTVKAKLTSVGGGVLYAGGSGRGRGKKDAKQVAAAALLESLLNQGGQTEADFLQPGKAKLQKAVQAKAQRRWQSGRARLADCKAHVLPAYSASGLQFIGDSTSFYSGGALATSEPGLAPSCLPLADYNISAKLGAHNGLFANEPFSSDMGFGWGAATEGGADSGYSHSALPLASEGFAQCAPLLQGFSMPFSHASFPCQLPY
ncbi:hypothetical protein WJX81_008595 [Elliptochloris bilobata]|uniref:DRBM domain-containing protein n=1 Tax=Elliptochloris bilobata TaxID=381761 RepID=A0AAW1RNC8_9CHLO